MGHETTFLLAQPWCTSIQEQKKGPITANAIYIHIPVMMMVKVIFMKQVKTEQMACSLFSLFHLYSQLWMPNKTAAYQAIT